MLFFELFLNYSLLMTKSIESVECLAIKSLSKKLKKKTLIKKHLKKYFEIIPLVIFDRIYYSNVYNNSKIL